MVLNVTCGVDDFQCIASIAAIVTCILSLGGCSVIFASWILLRSVRTPNRLMLLYLTIADFFVASGQLIGTSWTLGDHLHPDPINHNCSHPHPACVAQSFVSTLATMSSFLWSMLIAWHVYRSVLVPGTGTYWLDRHRWAQHLLCWGVPLGIVLVTLGRGRLGLDTIEEKGIPTMASGLWCWIKTSAAEIKGNYSAEIITFYIVTGQLWLYVAFLVIPVLYILSKRRIKVTPTELIHQSASLYESVKETDRLMTWIPAMFLLLRLWSCVRFVGNTLLVLELVPETATHALIFNKVLLIMQAVGDSAQGFTNCVLYCLLTDSVRVELRKVIGRGRRKLKKISKNGRSRAQNIYHEADVTKHHHVQSHSGNNSEIDPLLQPSCDD
ncbi:G-protein coupled receptor 157 [Lingula anatina]|uniref:G-protein coupled receptor 157 n=1 Tax=Lingula anatina TaxID=7574 RepID=A0A1S3H5Y3_LINAN|nr:G-protein coupled receptor 157 [Lingula anatina]|eukprot:XP_013381392.1 G-protein coupled receptor 157 [Lingula anatina]